jgi:hypothetical protein
MWGRAFLVALVVLGVLGTAGDATAAKKRKVRITSDPPGAMIYIEKGDKPPEDDGYLGETPVNTELPPGQYYLRAELKGYVDGYAELSVAKPTRRDKAAATTTVTLTKAQGLLLVEGAPDDAMVKIDEEGEPFPVAETVDGYVIPVGAYQVFVTSKGKQIHSQFIVIDSGEQKVVKVRTKKVAAVDPEDGGGGGDDGSDGGDDGTGTTVTRTLTPPVKRTGPIFAVGPLVEVGWRDFKYQGNVTTDTNLDARQDGEALLGVAIEINPFRITSVRAFHPLAIVLAGGFGIPQKVESNGELGSNLTTFWQRLQAGLRYRFGLGAIDLDLEAGYAGYIYRFSGDTGDIDRVPDASYQTIRFGGRLGVRVAGGALAPYVGGENRVVMSGGALETRYMSGGSDTQGYSFRAGFELKLWNGKLLSRLEGTYSKFDWTFKNATGMYVATGGTDLLYGLSMVIGYAY